MTNNENIDTVKPELLIKEMKAEVLNCLFLAHARKQITNLGKNLGGGEGGNFSVFIPPHQYVDHRSKYR